MLILSLQPAFLHQHFPYVRAQLVGEEYRPKPAIIRRRFPVNIRNVVVGALSLLTVVSVGVLAVLFTPDLYYRVFPADTAPITAQETGTPLGGDFATGTQATVPEETQPILPPLDTTLPEGTWLIIPRIGVRTQPQATVSEEEALKTGVWLVPDFGRPDDRTQPMILAAHRYGWQWWWQTDYWQYHSFYKLPELEPGDIVEVIYGQRKYYYEIYAGEEGEEITDYSADLILYTCKFLNSPLRHFRYARRVDIDKNTQQDAIPATSGFDK